MTGARRRAIAALLLALPALAVGGRVASAADPRLDARVIGDGARRVSLVARVDPAPLGRLEPDAVTVTAGGDGVTTTLAPVLADGAAVALVIDASAGAEPALQAGGRSGAAGFLLQMPARATSAVIADRTPAAVVSPSTVGVADDLRAASALATGGERSTSTAVTLALRALGPATARRVVVLYTTAADAGGEPAVDLADRMRQAGAVLAVVYAGPPSPFWTAAARAAGGLAVPIDRGRPIDAFDELADGLRASYLVEFDRPAAGLPLTLTVDTGDGEATTDLVLPPPAETSASPAPDQSTGSAVGDGEQVGGDDAAADPAAESGAGPWLWVVVALLLVAGLGTALVLGLRLRRRARAAELARTARLAAAREWERTTGARIAAGDAPPSLFEPRAARDAREVREVRDGGRDGGEGQADRVGNGP